MSYTTLVSTQTLEDHLGDPDWVVFDCRFTLTDASVGQRAYDKEHIPGARYVHLENDLSAPMTATSGRHPLPDPDVLAEKLGRWGVHHGTQVVVYDDTFGAMAARMWWLLRWLGHENVALLDGVYPKWRREGKPLTPEPPVVSPARFPVALREQMRMDVGAVQHGLAQGNIVLIDARAEERFSGEVEPLDKVAGHVPGALNRPYEDNLELGGDFLGAEELRGEYRDLIEGRSPGEVVHMCGSGVTACHNVLAMTHAGLEGARLYAGSWSEWITDPERPVATGMD